MGDSKTGTKNSSDSSRRTSVAAMMPSIAAALTDSVRRSVSESEIAQDAGRAVENSNNSSSDSKDSNNQEMAKWTLLIIGIFTLFRTVANAFFTICLVGLPALFLYLYHTCPALESFDSRKELKRVLRGHHLPDDHPDKPKGYLGTMVARATATVTAESAVLIGSQLELTSYKGAFVVAKMKLPTQQMTIYWLGIAGEWRYIHTSHDEEKQKMTN